MSNWNIANLEYTNDADKGVTIAHWRVTAEDGEYSASSYGTTSFTPDASAEGYVAYESLTEETVLGWVKEQLDVEAIESALADNIAAQKAPATLAGMPWVTEEAA